MIKKFYSHGKFLITAEYLIMNGAVGIAVPLKYGQSLIVKKNSLNKIIWQTNIKDNLWFKAEFDNDFNIIKSSNNETASFLSKLLMAAKKLNSKFELNFGFNIASDINFDINWGLGSSSTLISNIAYWANINPFKLFYEVANGSAYDIACAREKTAILYKINNKTPDYKVVEFNPKFKNQLYFAYLGKKQNSEKSIKYFKEKLNFKEKHIKYVSELTDFFFKAKSINEFASLINEHENLIGSILKKTPVKNEFFNNFQGEIKSLGAWGGDFIMIASELPYNLIKKYFNKKCINVVFKFEDIVL